MKKSFLYIILFTMIVSVASGNVSDRRKQLLSLINSELSEVVRLNRQTNARNPNLLLRMAELLLEKARLIKEEENLKYLTLSPEKRRITNKKDFFRQSRKYFIQAQKTAKLILKRFKKFRKIGDVYYILAFNEREFGRDDRAKKYFIASAKKSKKGTEANRRSKLALAEILFNKMKYKNALPLYAQALKGKKDKWWTKDAINYAWCLFYRKKYDQAIEVMREVYRLSKTGGYIDVSALAERDLARFYSGSGRTKEAVAFYKQIGGDISSNLLSVGKFLLDQGKFSSAERTFVEAEKYSNKESEKVDALINLLALYQKFGRTNKHLETSGRLVEYKLAGKLNEQQGELLAFQIKKNASLLQNQVVGKTYRRQRKVRVDKAKDAVAYFELSKKLDPSKSYVHEFHAAETYYAIGYYNSAVPYYNTSFEGATRNGDTKFRSLALNGLTASLGKKSIKKSIKEQYLIPVYISNINQNPKSKKSFTIFQRLFSLYIKKGDMVNAEKTLYEFKNNFPQAQSKQEAMIAKIMDYHKNKGDAQGIKKWVRKINSGEFVVSKKYAKKLKILLLTMQFEGVEKANSIGDKKLALRGYVEIYKDPESNQDAKRNAAYNIAVLFHELGDTERNFAWSQRALNEMQAREVRKFSASFLTMAGDLFNQQHFTKSGAMYQMVFDKLCKVKSRDKQTFFKNANVTYLSDYKIKEAKALVDSAYACNLPVRSIETAELDILKALGELGHWSEFEDYLNKLEKSRKLWPMLIYHIEKLRKAHLSSGNRPLAKLQKSKVLRYYNYSVKQKYSIPLEALDIVASYKIKQLAVDQKNFRSITLAFPEKTFSLLLTKKFKALDRLTSNALQVLKVGSGKGIVSSYKFLVENYSAFVTEVESFTPANKSPGYVQSFQRGMRNKVINPLKKKVMDFKREAKRQISSSQILSEENGLFINNLKLPFNIKYIPSFDGVIMDRGGRK